MTCERSLEAMIDVLYGEELDSRHCFEFFRHLDSCESCNKEYLELIETREVLAGWTVKDEQFTRQINGSGRLWHLRPSRVPMWPLLHKIAAGFLIAVGIISIAQYMGFGGGRRVTVSEQQLVEMVNDMIVAKQSEERQIIGAALIRITDQFEMQRKADKEQMYEYLKTVHQYYRDNLEENQQTLKTILTNK